MPGSGLSTGSALPATRRAMENELVGGAVWGSV